MRRGIDLFCTWSGIVFAVLFGIGFAGIARFVPPLNPADTAQQTAAIFREHSDAIRIGMLLSYIGSAFYLAFGASINTQTRRIPGVPKVLVQLQTVAFAVSVLLIAGPMMIWWTAAFRPESYAPDTVQVLNDFGWIAFLVGWVPFVTWYMATGAAILCDADTDDPIYPRWSGFLCLVIGFAQSSATLLPFFKTGPFAWDGLFSWWLPVSEFFVLFIVLTVLTTKAINRKYRAGTSESGGRRELEGPDVLAGRGSTA